jgi:hypothetical protein
MPATIGKYREDMGNDSSPQSIAKEIGFFRRLIQQNIQSSAYLTLDKQYNRLRVNAGSLKSLLRNWDSYDSSPPATETIELTLRFLAKIYQESFLPSSIVPSAEGGAALYFSREGKSAYLEYRNSGELIFAMYDQEAEPIIIELEPTDADESRAIRLLRTYLS